MKTTLEHESSHRIRHRYNEKNSPCFIRGVSSVSISAFVLLLFLDFIIRSHGAQMQLEIQTVRCSMVQMNVLITGAGSSMEHKAGPTVCFCEGQEQNISVLSVVLLPQMSISTLTRQHVHFIRTPEPSPTCHVYSSTIM